MAAPPADALTSLDSLIRTASTLLTQLQAVLSDIHKDPSKTVPCGIPDATPTSAVPLDALALARDSASLIRAHGTKVSLLIINEPFTPSAISSVVRQLVAGPVPAIASATQACGPERYTVAVRRELASRSQQVLAQLHELIQKVPRDGKALDVENKSGFASGAKGSIPATAILWAACDRVIDLASMGVAGFFALRVGQCRDTLQDVMEELREWGDEQPGDYDEVEDGGEDGDEDGDVDGLADGLGATHVSTQAMVDELINSQRPIPRLDPDRIRPRLESCLKRLRLAVLLYEAAIKHRFAKPPLAAAGPNLPSRLDEAAQALQALPDRFEDLAAAFYELQPRSIDAAMDRCVADALAASQLLATTWDGAPDDFSKWVKAFQMKMATAW